MSKWLHPSYWRRRRQIPRAWSEASFRMKHPLIQGGALGPRVDLEALYQSVLYLAERKKIDMGSLEVRVYTKDGTFYHGNLRPHCIAYLEGHLQLAVVGGNQLAIKCGQPLRSEVEVAMP